MRKNFGAKPLSYPQPVFILATYNEDGTPNAMNAAWGGISASKALTMCIDARHKTTENILARKAFTVSMGEAKYMTECDYVGIVSANDEPDKLKKSGFHTVKSEFVNAPVINELPITLECELLKIVDGGMYIGKIVNVSADEKVLGADGLPDLSKFTPITFDPVHHTYIALGETVGNAFSDGKQMI